LDNTKERVCIFSISKAVGWSSLCLYHWDGNDVDVVQKYLVQEKEKEKQRSIKNNNNNRMITISTRMN